MISLIQLANTKNNSNTMSAVTKKRKIASARLNNFPDAVFEVKSLRAELKQSTMAIRDIRKFILDANNIPNALFNHHIMPMPSEVESLRAKLEQSTKAFRDLQKFILDGLQDERSSIHKNVDRKKLLSWGIDSYSFASVSGGRPCLNGETFGYTTWKLVEEKIPTHSEHCEKVPGKEREMRGKCCKLTYVNQVLQKDCSHLSEYHLDYD